MRKIEFDDDPLNNPKSPKKQPPPPPSPKRNSAIQAPQNAKRASLLAIGRRSSIKVDWAGKIREFEKKSLIPYTEERDILILPSIFSVQFEKTGLHERVFPVALQKEIEIKKKCLGKK